MTKLNWSKAKKFAQSEAASPGRKPSSRTIRTWDELEQFASGTEVEWTGARRVSEAEIESAKTPKGAWTRHTLAGWGVPWPPPRGWKAALIAGVPIEQGAALKDSVRESVKESLEAKLLHQVVMALINAGKGDFLNELPEVSAYFGCRVPTVADIVGGRPETAIIEGGITWEDRVYRFSVARTVKAA